MGTAADAAYQPDLLVKLASEGDASYVGEGLFEPSALTQSRSQPAFPGAAASFRVLLKNAGDAPDRFVLTGGWNGNGLSVRCLDPEGVDRSAALAAGGYATGPLAPGASLSLLVQVTPSALPLGASYRVTLSAASAGDPGRVDQVKTESIACSTLPALTVSAPPDGRGHPGSVVTYPYTVTNVGSEPNSFTLTLSGDAAWPGTLYADDGAGGGSAGDGVRQEGENRETSGTGPLAPGTSYSFFLAVAIPTSSVDRSRADTRLAVSGTGASGADLVSTSAIAATITVAEKVRNLTRGGPFADEAEALPGDTLEYRMTVTNSGSVPATAVAVENPLPGSVACLPGTLRIATSAAGEGPPCPAEQCGWVRETAGKVVAGLGEGSADPAGGSLRPGMTLHVFFRVQVE